MAAPTNQDDKREQALDGIAGIAPPEDDGAAAGRGTTDVREGADAESVPGLKQDPADPDAKLDVELDESFPSSDAPSTSRPGTGEPAPSSGYDEEAERDRTRGL